MKKEEIKKVYKALENHGDDFWEDRKEISDNDEEVISSNKTLFVDILYCLRKDGYDLKLVKIKK